MTDAFYVPSYTRTRKSEDRLVARIRSVERRVDALARTPQLTNSAIDDGAVLVTAGGTQTGVIGQQYDGTSGYAVLVGPNPPVPSLPVATAVPGGIKVKWDGGWKDPQTGFTSPVVAPLDLARIEVEVDDNPSFTNHLDITKPNNGSITAGVGGGEITVAWPASGTTLYVRLIARSTSGARSTPSLVATVVSGKVGLGDLGFDLANYAASNTIQYGTGALPDPTSFTGRIGTLFVQETSAGPPPQYLTWRWTGAAWQQLQDQGVTSALANAAAAQTAADTKAKLFTQATTPTYSGAANTAYWIDTSAGGGNVPKVWSGSAWTVYKLGNGAIQPNSLVASNVIATGTVSAALLESLLVLTTTVIAGNATGTHAAMTPTGFRVYDPQGNEVIRLGTDTDDYFGVLDATGVMRASVDQTGQANFNGLNVTGVSRFNGVDLATSLANAQQGTLASSYNNGMNYLNITTAFGLGEVSFRHSLLKSYWIHIQIPHIWSDTANTRALFTVRVTTDGSAPTTTSPIVDSAFHTFRTGGDFVESGPILDIYGNFPAAGEGGLVRLIVCVERFDGTGDINVGSGAAGYPRAFRAWVSDMGPNINDTYIANTGGGAVTPKATYQTGALSPTLFGSWRGDNTLRSDTTDVVQGLDPSGFNGDGHGGWNFAIPNIAAGATINWVNFYIYSNSTYFNSGAHALIRLVTDANSATPTVLQTVFEPSVTYPKPGGVTITLPSSWYASFKGRTSIGLYLGPGSLVAGGGTNELYYMRADGPGARLQINYTQ